ncbi:type II toxin-antitoxin system ParD family antitoxin [uncultured Chryseobacterium sp.]|nr:type II toxin-antitoxin system ParD family antitoxin [uncultured Chryseobacterium sp.]
MKQNTENKIQILKNAIQKGIDSGIAKDFDAEKHLQSLKDKAKKSN